VFQWEYRGEKPSFFKIQDTEFLALGIPAAAAVDIREMEPVLYLFIFFLKEKIETHMSGYIIHNL